MTSIFLPTIVDHFTTPCWRQLSDGRSAIGENCIRRRKKGKERYVHPSTLENVHKKFQTPKFIIVQNSVRSNFKLQFRDVPRAEAHSVHNSRTACPLAPKFGPIFTARRARPHRPMCSINEQTSFSDFTNKPGSTLQPSVPIYFSLIMCISR